MAELTAENVAGIEKSLTDATLGLNETKKAFALALATADLGTVFTLGAHLVGPREFIERQRGLLAKALRLRAYLKGVDKAAVKAERDRAQAAVEASDREQTLWRAAHAQRHAPLVAAAKAALAEVVPVEQAEQSLAIIAANEPHVAAALRLIDAAKAKTKTKSK